MNKVYVFILFIVSICFINLNIVFADTDSSVKISIDDQVVLKNKEKDINILLEAFNQKNGISSCEFELLLDKKINISEIGNTYNWKLQENIGNRYIVHTNNPLYSGNNIIFKFSIKAKNSGNVYVKNIKCNNGNEDISYDDIVYNISVNNSNDNKMLPYLISLILVIGFIVAITLFIGKMDEYKK